MPHLFEPDEKTLLVIQNKVILPNEIGHFEELGFAIFANDDIETGTLICEYQGEIDFENENIKDDDYSFRLLDVGLLSRNLLLIPLQNKIWEGI